MSGLDTSVIQSISDFGITLVLSGVVVVFVIQGLGFFINQAKKMSDLASNQMESIKTLIETGVREILNLVNIHDKSSNNKLNTLVSTTNNILEEEERIQRMVDTMNQQNRAYILQLSSITEIQRSILKDMKHHCPAVYSRDIILQELLTRGYITREQLDEVFNDLDMEHTKK